MRSKVVATLEQHIEPGVVDELITVVSHEIQIATARARPADLTVMALIRTVQRIAPMPRLEALRTIALIASGGKQA